MMTIIPVHYLLIDTVHGICMQVNNENKMNDCILDTLFKTLEKTNKHLIKNHFT